MTSLNIVSMEIINSIFSGNVKKFSIQKYMRGYHVNMKYDGENTISWPEVVNFGLNRLNTNLEGNLREYINENWVWSFWMECRVKT